MIINPASLDKVFGRFPSYQYYDNGRAPIAGCSAQLSLPCRNLSCGWVYSKLRPELFK